MKALASKSCELTSFSCEECHERRESKILGQQWDVRDAVLFGRKRFGRAGPQIGPKYALKAAHATPIHHGHRPVHGAHAAATTTSGCQSDDFCVLERLVFYSGPPRQPRMPRIDPCQVLASTLTLSQPGAADYAHPILGSLAG